MVGRSCLYKDRPKVQHVYLETEVTLSPLLHTVHLTGIGQDEDGLDSDVMNSCSGENVISCGTNVTVVPGKVELRK